MSKPFASARWLDANEQIIYLYLSGRWTSDQMLETVYRCRDLASSVAHETALLVNMENSAGFPPGVMTYLRQAARIVPPGRHDVAIVGLNALEIVLVESIFRALFPSMLSRLSFHKTISDAHSTLNETLNYGELTLD